MEDAGLTEVAYGAITVLRAPNGGVYPYGNSLVVRGSGGVLLVDPSLAVRTLPAGADAIVVSHGHEDHTVGLGRYDVPVSAHTADVAAVRSTDVMLDALGFPVESTGPLAQDIRSEFDLSDRPDATGLVDGQRFDLGDRTVTVVHLPGHTPGHSGLFVEPDGFLYVADIDLSSFGPYYGDITSSLEDFEASMERCAGIEARWYGTFHHKGVIEGAGEFRRRLADYRGVIRRRDERILALLGEPLTIEELARHRTVYRPHVDEPHVPVVEARVATLHVDRLLRRGAVVVDSPGRYRAVEA